MLGFLAIILETLAIFHMVGTQRIRKRGYEARFGCPIAESKKGGEMLTQFEKRISELDKLFIRLYEDNGSGKISDERFAQMSANYDDEQQQLKQTVSELKAFIEATKQKNMDVSNFIQIVRKYTYINVLTSEIMHGLVEKIAVHAPDKSSWHREQRVEIYFGFNAASASTNGTMTKRERLRRFLRSLFKKSVILLYRARTLKRDFLFRVFTQLAHCIVNFLGQAEALIS